MDDRTIQEARRGDTYIDVDNFNRLVRQHNKLLRRTFAPGDFEVQDDGAMIRLARRTPRTGIVKMTAEGIGDIYIPSFVTPIYTDMPIITLTDDSGTILEVGNYYVCEQMYDSSGMYWVAIPSVAVDLSVLESAFGISYRGRIKATGAETIVLDTRDWRRRTIDIAITEDDPAVDGAASTPALHWVRCAVANVDMVTLNEYTIRVDTAGRLVAVASAASTNYYVVWARASKQVFGICTCWTADYVAYDVKIAGYTQGMFPTGCSPEEEFTGTAWNGIFTAQGGCSWRAAGGNRRDYFPNANTYIVDHSIYGQTGGGKYWYLLTLSQYIGACEFWRGESDRLDHPHGIDGVIINRKSGVSQTPTAILLEKAP